MVASEFAKNHTKGGASRSRGFTGYSLNALLVATLIAGGIGCADAETYYVQPSPSIVIDGIQVVNTDKENDKDGNPDGKVTTVTANKGEMNYYTSGMDGDGKTKATARYDDTVIADYGTPENYVAGEVQEEYGYNVSGIAIGHHTNIVSEASFTPGRIPQDRLVQDKNGTWGRWTKFQSGIAIGDYANAGAALSLAIGQYARVGDVSGMAIGAAAYAKGFNALAMMRQSAAIGEYSTAIGTTAYAKGDGSFAFGASSKAKGRQSIAIGVAIPKEATTADNTRAAGYNEELNTEANADRSFAFGTLAYTGEQATDSIAFGSDTSVKSKDSISVGRHAVVEATADGSMALGKEATIKENANNALALGPDTEVAGAGSIAMGLGTKTGENAVMALALGGKSEAQTAASIVMGSFATSKDNAQNAIAVGTNAGVSGSKSMAMGFGSSTGTEAEDGIALGSNAEVNASGAMAIGKEANAGADAQNSMAIGVKSIVNGAHSVAIGEYAQVDGNKSMLMGSGEVIPGKTETFPTFVKTEVQGDKGETITYYYNSELKDQLKAVYMGTGKTEKEAEKLAIEQTRKQLSDQEIKALTDETNEGKYQVEKSTGNLVPMVPSITHDPKTVYSTVTGNNSIGIGNSIEVSGDSAIAIGNNTKVTTTNSITIGDASVATGVQSVNLGVGGAASGAMAMNLGSGGIASGPGATNLGMGGQATGNNALNLGPQGTASGQQAVSVGSGGNAAGINSLNFGTLGNSTKENAINIGTGGRAYGINSINMGTKGRVVANNSMSFGFEGAVNERADNSISIGNSSIVNSRDSLSFGNRNKIELSRKIPLYVLSDNDIDYSLKLTQAYIDEQQTKLDNLRVDLSDQVEGTENYTEIKEQIDELAVKMKEAEKEYNQAIKDAPRMKELRSKAFVNGVLDVTKLTPDELTEFKQLALESFDVPLHDVVALGNNITDTTLNSVFLGNNTGYVAYHPEYSTREEAVFVNGKLAPSQPGVETEPNDPSTYVSVPTEDIGNSTRGIDNTYNNDTFYVYRHDEKTGEVKVTEVNSNFAGGDSVVGAVSVGGRQAMDANGNGITVKRQISIYDPKSKSVIKVEKEIPVYETRRIQNVAPGLISSVSTDAINGSQLYGLSQIVGNLATSIADTVGGGATVNPDGSVNFMGDNESIGGTQATTWFELMQILRTDVRGDVTKTLQDNEPVRVTNGAAEVTERRAADGHSIFDVHVDQFIEAGARNGNDIVKGGDNKYYETTEIADKTYVPNLDGSNNPDGSKGHWYNKADVDANAQQRDGKWFNKEATKDFKYTGGKWYHPDDVKDYVYYNGHWYNVADTNDNGKPNNTAPVVDSTVEEKAQAINEVTMNPLTDGNLPKVAVLEDRVVDPNTGEGTRLLGVESALGDYTPVNGENGMVTVKTTDASVGNGVQDGMTIGADGIVGNNTFLEKLQKVGAVDSETGKPTADSISRSYAATLGDLKDLSDTPMFFEGNAGEYTAPVMNEEGTEEVTAASNTKNTFDRKVGQLTKIVGDVKVDGADALAKAKDLDTKLSDGNIGVVSNGEDTLTVKLAKDINGLTSITTTNITEEGDTYTTVVNGDGVTTTKNGKDGADGYDGKTVIGAGTIGLNGKDGANGLTIKGDKGADGIDGKNGKGGMTRIIYNDGTTDHEVATLDDGLKFGANEPNDQTKNPAAVKLGGTVNILGGDKVEPTEPEGKATRDYVNNDSFSGKNIKTVIDGNDINIQMADKPEFKEITVKDGADTPKTVISKNGVTITPATGDEDDKKVSLTDAGLSNGGNQITNVASGLTNKDGSHPVTDITTLQANDPRLTNAVNVGDLQTVAKGLVDTGIKLNTSGQSTETGAATVKLGDTINVVNGANTKVSAIDDSVNGTHTFHVDVNGLPATYVTKDGKAVTKIGDHYYTADQLNDKGLPADVNTNSDTVVNNISLVDKNGNITVENDGKVTKTTPVLKNVGSGFESKTFSQIRTEVEKSKATENPGPVPDELTNAVNVGDLVDAINTVNTATGEAVSKPLTFAGDVAGTGYDKTSFDSKLGSTVKVTGGATGLTSDKLSSSNNVGVEVTKDTLTVKLAKELSGLTSVGGDTNQGKISFTSASGNKPTGDEEGTTTPITTPVVGMNNSQVQGVVSGLQDNNGQAVALKDAKDGMLTNAVNVGDLKDAVNNITDGTGEGATGGFALAGNTMENGKQVEVHQDLGKVITVRGGLKEDDQRVTDAKGIANAVTDQNTYVSVKDKEDGTGKELVVEMAKDLKDLTSINVVNGKDGASGENGTSTTIDGDGVTTDGKVAVARDGKDGEAGQDGKNAVELSKDTDDAGHIVLNGKDGEKGTDGEDGKLVNKTSVTPSADMTVVQGNAGLQNNTGFKDDGNGNAVEYMDRIQYKDSAGKVHQIATMDDGLKFGANEPNDQTKNPKAVKLGETVNILGGDKGTGTDRTYVSSGSFSGKNIKTVIDGNDINIQMADKPEFKEITVKEGEDAPKTVIDKNGVTITPATSGDDKKVSLTGTGLSNGGNQITNVASGLGDKTLTGENAVTDKDDEWNNAATIGDLKTAADAAKTEVTGTGAAEVTSTTADDGHSVYNVHVDKVVEFKATDGSDVVYGADGKYYKPETIENLVYVDGKWYNKADVKDGKPIDGKDPVAVTPETVKSSLVNPNPSDEENADNSVVLDNVGSAIGGEVKVTEQGPDKGKNTFIDNLNKAGKAGGPALDAAVNVQDLKNVVDTGIKLNTEGQGTTGATTVKIGDTINVVNGANTKVSAITNSTANDIHTFHVDVVGIPATYVDAAGNKLTNVGGKFYAADKVNADGTLKKDAVEVTPKNVALINSDGSVTTKGGYEKTATTTNPAGTQLKNVASGLQGKDFDDPTLTDADRLNAVNVGDLEKVFRDLSFGNATRPYNLKVEASGAASIDDKYDLNDIYTVHVDELAKVAGKNTDGRDVVRAGDHKFYLAEDVKDKVFYDGHWYNKADIEGKAKVDGKWYEKGEGLVFADDAQGHKQLYKATDVVNGKPKSEAKPVEAVDVATIDAPKVLEASTLRINMVNPNTVEEGTVDGRGADETTPVAVGNVASSLVDGDGNALTIGNGAESKAAVDVKDKDSKTVNAQQAGTNAFIDKLKGLNATEKTAEELKAQLGRDATEEEVKAEAARAAADKSTLNSVVTVADLKNAVETPLFYEGDVADANTSPNTFGRTLGQKTQIVGGVKADENAADEAQDIRDKLTDGNIGVVSNGVDTLTVKLAKKLTGLESAEFTKTTKGENGQPDVTKTTTIGSDGVTTNGIVKVTNGKDGENAKPIVEIKEGTDAEGNPDGGHIVLNGKDGKDGKDAAKGDDGAFKDGEGITPQADMHVVQGDAGLQNNTGHKVVEGKDTEYMDRIQYKDSAGKEHQVATMDDGLIFTGNIGDNVKRSLGTTLNIKGDMAVTTKGEEDKDLTPEEQLKDYNNRLSNGNIGVVSNGTNELTVKLAKNLTDMASIGGADGKDGKISFSSVETKVPSEQEGQPETTVTTQVVDMNGSRVNNVQSGLKGNDGKQVALKDAKDGMLTNAVNVGDLKDAVNNITNGTSEGATGGFGLTGNNGTVKQDLGKAITVKGGMSDGNNTTDQNTYVAVKEVRNEKDEVTGKELVVEMAKDLTDLNSVTTTDADGNTTQMNSKGLATTSVDKDGNVKVTTVTSDGLNIVKTEKGKDKDGKDITITKTVSLTNDGLDNGGNKITNVAAGTEDSDAVNVSQLKQYVTNNSKTYLEAGKNTTVDGDGTEKNKYKVNVADNLVLGGKDENGKDGVNGSVGVKGSDGKDGVTVKADPDGGHIVINGKDGQKGSKGEDGKFVPATGKDTTVTPTADITTVQGDAGLQNNTGYKDDGNGNAVEYMDRIQYKDSAGKDHQVATMDDGLIFAGNIGDNVKRSLGTTLNIKGDMAAGDEETVDTYNARLSNGNIGVVSNGTDGVTVKLAKALTDMSSIGGVDGKDGKISFSSVETKVPAEQEGQPETTVTTQVVDMNGSRVSNVQSGLKGDDGKQVALKDAKDGMLTNAVNVGDLQNAVNNITNGTDKGAIGGFGLTSNNGTVKQDLGKAITVKGGMASADNATAENTYVDVENDTLVVKINKKLTGMTSAEFGQKGEDGKDGQPGKPGVDGQIGVRGADGAAVVINGKDGSIGLKGADGKDGKDGVSANITVKEGKPGINGKDGETMTRIVYKDGKDGKEHQVATLDDGLKFGANEPVQGQNNPMAVTLGGTVNILGGNKIVKDGKIIREYVTDTTFSGKNIKTVIDGNDINIQMADKPEFKGVTVKDGTDKPETEIANNGITITPAGKDGQSVSLTEKGLDNGKNQITNVASGFNENENINSESAKTNTNAANISDLAKAADQIKKDITIGIGEGAKGGFGLTGNNGTVKQDLGNAITIKGGMTDGTNTTDQNTYVAVKDNADGTGKELVVEMAKDLTDLNSVTTGDDKAGTTMNKDGITITKPGKDKDGKDITKTVSLTGDGLNNGGNKITNVAKGDISANSTDAVNGSQLWDAMQGAKTHLTDGKNTKVAGSGTENDPYKVNVADNLNLGAKDGKDGKDGIDGSIGVNGKDGSAVVINGKDGSIGLNGKDGANGLTIKGDKGADGIEGKNGKDGMTRIIYETKDPKNPETVIRHEVATMDDGLAFAGNVGDNVKRPLGTTLTIQGDMAAKDTESVDSYKARLSNGNIGVVSDGKGTLEVKLAKDLKGLDSITFNNGITINKDSNDMSSIKDNGNNLVTGNAVFDYIQKNGTDPNAVKYDDGSHTSVTLGGKEAKGPVTLTNVKDGRVAPGSTDAVNGSQLYQTNANVNKLSSRINRVGAGAAALAALHPLDFDPDEKWDITAGYGNYNGANAVALGAFYRPNEDTLFSIGASMGGGENMVNAGVTIKLGQGNNISTSRVAMAKEIRDLREEVAQLKAVVAAGHPQSGIDLGSSALFPDVKDNHWAYEYVTKLAGAGLLKGYPDGEFKGNRVLTRYEFATVVYRMLEQGLGSTDDEMNALVKEFASELKYISIDTVHKDKDGNPTVQRVRTTEYARTHA